MDREEAASRCYSTNCSLAQRVENSTTRVRVNERLFCDHCSQDLALKTFKKHKKLYLKDDGTWIKDSTSTEATESSEFINYIEHNICVCLKQRESVCTCVCVHVLVWVFMYSGILRVWV